MSNHLAPNLEEVKALLARGMSIRSYERELRSLVAEVERLTEGISSWEDMLNKSEDRNKHYEAALSKIVAQTTDQLAADLARKALLG